MEYRPPTVDCVGRRDRSTYNLLICVVMRSKIPKSGSSLGLFCQPTVHLQSHRRLPEIQNRRGVKPTHNRSIPWAEWTGPACKAVGWALPAGAFLLTRRRAVKAGFKYVRNLGKFRESFISKTLGELHLFDIMPGF